MAVAHLISSFDPDDTVLDNTVLDDGTHLGDGVDHAFDRGVQLRAVETPRPEDHDRETSRVLRVDESQSHAERRAAGRAALVTAGERTKPVAMAATKNLPVLPALSGLFPNGLQRGSTVGVEGIGATTLAMAMAAGPSTEGSWIAVIGLPSLGLAAAAEAGLSLGRFAAVAAPPPDLWSTVVATLIDAFDVVLVAPQRSRMAEQRRLVARARRQGSVLITVAEPHVVARAPAGIEGVGGPPDFVVRSRRMAQSLPTWRGLGNGHGCLRARLAEVEVAGRRGGRTPRRLLLWLPGPDGAVSEAVEAADLAVDSSQGFAVETSPVPIDERVGNRGVA